MGRACLLLDSSSARVKDVAEALGYDDAFYFSRVFKTWTSVAPSHYRNLGADLRLEIKERLWPNNEKPLSSAAPAAISFGKITLVGDQHTAKDFTTI
jgi:AraC-like DNA-binding protein